MPRHKSLGPANSALSGNIDELFNENARNKSKLRKIQEQVQQMDSGMMGVPSGVVFPSDKFLIGRKTTSRGEVPTLEYVLTGTEKNVTVDLIRVVDNPMTGATADAIKTAKQTRLQFTFDVSDEERETKLLQRQFRPPLDFLTSYGCTRIKATFISPQGLVGEAVNPSTNPYKTAPFPYLKKVPPSGIPAGGLTVLEDAIFTTCDSTGTNCPNSTQVITGFGPGFAMGASFASSFKSKNKGIKANLNFTIPATMEEATVVLIPRFADDGSDLFMQFLNDDKPVDPIRDTFTFTKKERDNGRATRLLNVLLDFNTEYILIRLVGRGDNVGGPDRDIVRLIATDATGIRDLSKNPVTGDPASARAGFTTPAEGAAPGGGVSQLNQLLPDNPWVSAAKDANGNLIDFDLEEDGVRVTQHYLLPRADAQTPSTVTNVKAKIIRQKAYDAGKFDKFLSSEWEEFTPDELSNAKFQREFNQVLKYNRQYRLMQLIAEGSGIGGPGIDKGKNPFPQFPSGSTAGTPPRNLVNPAGMEVIAQFTTPDRNGNFPTAGQGGLSFVGIVGRRPKKTGVLVKPKINVPTGTESVLMRIKSRSDNTIVAHTFDDLDLFPRTDGQPGSFFQEEFGQRLDANTTYDVIRLIATGPGINITGSGDPNQVKNPVVKGSPASIGSFSTASSIGFFSTDGATQAQTPAAPIQSDITTSLVADAAKSLVTVWASQFRGTVPPSNFPLGTSVANAGAGVAAGAVNFGDTGADTAGVLVDRATDASGTGKIPFSLPLTDLTVPFVQLELSGLTPLERYQLKNAFISGGGDMLKTPPAANIFFRAGTSIDLQDLLVLPPPLVPAGSTKKFAITALAKNGDGDIVATVAYNEPATPVVIRNIRIFKFIVGKSTVMKEIAGSPRILRDDQSNFTAGVHTFDFDFHVPSAVQVILTAQLTALQGGVPTTLTDTLTFNSDALPGLTDPGRPQYSGFRTDGGSNASPFRVPNLRLRWRPTLIRVRLNKPDVNMLSFDRIICYFLFQGSVDNGPAGIRQFVYYYNPDTDQFFSFIADPFLTPDSDGGIGLDLGGAASDTFGVNRPDAASAGPDFPTQIYNDVKAGSGTFTARLYILNRSTTASNIIGGLPNALIVESAPLFFPFTGLAQTGNVT